MIRRRKSHFPGTLTIFVAIHLIMKPPAEHGKTVMALILAAALLLPAISVWLVVKSELRAAKRSVKEKMIAGLDRSELIQFDFSEPELQLLDWQHDSEFVLNGLWYDVVESEQTEKGWRYLCFPDKQETRLNKELAGLFSMRMCKPLPGQDSKLHMVLLLKLLFPPDLPAFQIGLCQDKGAFFTSSYSASEGHQQIPDQPPKRQLNVLHFTFSVRS